MRTKPSELKTCPFCDRAPYYFVKGKGSCNELHFVECENRNSNCDCTLGPFPTKREAFSRWNSRVSPEWSRESPTESGWYWMWEGTNNPLIVRFDPKWNTVSFFQEGNVFHPSRYPGDFLELTTEYLREFGGGEIYWLKVEQPDMPPQSTYR